MTMTTENIQKTDKGIEYAYAEEGKFDTEYTVECTEADEEFATNFYAPSYYTEDMLKNIANNLAVLWGAEVTAVYKS